MHRVSSEIDSKIATLVPDSAKLVRFESSLKALEGEAPCRQWVLDFIQNPNGPELETIRCDSLSRVDRTLWKHVTFEEQFKRDSFEYKSWKLRLGIVVAPVHRSLTRILRLELSCTDVVESWPVLLATTEKWAKLVSQWSGANQMIKEVFYREEATIIHETWAAPLRVVAPLFLYLGGFRKKKKGRTWRRYMTLEKQQDVTREKGSLVVRISNGRAVLVSVSEQA